MHNIKQYKTIVFDCDGVLLNSNKVKTDAFYQAAISYGEVFADRLVQYHVQNGGVSRYKKFSYFLTEIVQCKEVDPLELKALLERYSDLVWKGLLACEVAVGLHALRELTCSSKWMIVSGGDQAELRRLFEERGISHYFDAGIYGSPSTKESILESAYKNRVISRPALFIGDSQYDYTVASQMKFDFMFLTGWSEFKEWKTFFESVNNDSVFIRNNLSELL